MFAALAMLCASYCYSNCSATYAAYKFKQKPLLSPFVGYAKNPYEITDEEYKSLLSESLNNKRRVCALKYTDQSNTTYVLSTFEDEAMARQQNYIITHQGKCGVCSTIQDLSVYLLMDLTHSEIKCGIPDKWKARDWWEIE
jgi:hypothetical protein